jgi:hypothetical protein
MPGTLWQIIRRGIGCIGFARERYCSPGNGTMPMLGGKDQVGARTYLDSGVVNELHELEHWE